MERRGTPISSKRLFLKRFSAGAFALTTAALVACAGGGGVTPNPSSANTRSTFIVGDVAGGGSGKNAVRNGDFATGHLKPWTSCHSQVSPRISKTDPFAGKYDADIDPSQATGVIRDSELCQVITIPPNALLTFQRRDVTNVSGVSKSFWYAGLKTAGGSAVFTIGSHLRNGGWTLTQASLARFAGKKYTLFIRVVGDHLTRRIHDHLYIDAVAVMSQQPTPPPSTSPSPTGSASPAPSGPPTASPSPLPSGTPTASPLPSPTASPSPSPSPTATPGTLTVNPSSVTLCPSSGPKACNTNQIDVAVSQANFPITFTFTTTCASTVAAITAVSATGPNATFQVSGQSRTGTCSATFTGGNGAQAHLAIVITQSGIIIDSHSQHPSSKGSTIK